MKRFISIGYKVPTYLRTYIRLHEAIHMRRWEGVGVRANDEVALRILGRMGGCGRDGLEGPYPSV